ncbi:MAG: hypothetical protein ABR576_13935 [Thermoanaerobaculia bacterium]
MDPDEREPRAAVDFEDRFAPPRLPVAAPRALALRFDVVFFRVLVLEAPRALPPAPPRRDVPRERLFPPPFEEPRPLPPPVLLRVCAI